MVGILTACAVLVLAVILVIVLVDIHRLRANTRDLHEELMEISTKLDQLQSHM